MESNITSQTIKRWLLKKLAGTLTDEEASQLRVWMEASPANKRLAERITSVAFLKQAMLDKNKEARRSGWNSLYRRMGYVRSLRLSWVGRHRLVIAAAAVVLLFLLSGIRLYYVQQEPVLQAGHSHAIVHIGSEGYSLEGNMLDFKRFITLQAPPEVRSSASGAARIINVPRGAEFRLMLEDGTLIHLGPESSLTIPADYSREKRIVTLSGKAYAEVYKDSLHPFLIQTPLAQIRVRGTQLNIEAYRDEPEERISLVEGKAEVRAKGAWTELPVAYMATIGKDRQLSLAGANLYECTAWHHNRLIFENRPMESIMRELGRWYDFKAVFSSNRVREFRVTIDMDKYDTFNALARMIENMNEIHIKIRKSSVIISETVIK